MSARLASPSNGRMISRTSPFTRAASAALARPGPIAAATSAGVEPAGISRTEPSGRLIFRSSLMRIYRPSNNARAMAQGGADRKCAGDSGHSAHKCDKARLIRDKKIREVACGKQVFTLISDHDWSPDSVLKGDIDVPFR